MELKDILHGKDDCCMLRHIVASHVCLCNHYLITWEPKKDLDIWDPKKEYILWVLDDRGNWDSVKTFVAPTPNLSPEENAEILFEEWLESL